MQIQSAASARDTTSTPTTKTSDMGDMFMTLLVTQLKTQDPTSPMDPTQFVGQLVQFNSLNELIKIRETLQTVSGTPSSTNDAGEI